MKKTLLLMLGLCLVFAGTVSAENIVGNSSLEDQSPAFWGTLNGTIGTELAIESAVKYAGVHSFKVTKSATTADVVGWVSVNNATLYWNNAGAGTYALTGRIKTVGVNTSPANDDAKVGIVFEFKNAAGGELTTETLWADQSLADKDWAELTGATILTEAPASLVIKLIMGKNATGTVYFDELGCNTADSWTMWPFNAGAEDVTGWMDWYSNNGSYAVVTDKQAHTGTYSIEMSQPDTCSALSELVYYSKPYPVEAGAWYKIGVWVKTEGVNDSSIYEPGPFATRKYEAGWINLCYFWHKGDIETSWDLEGGDKFVYIEQRDPTTGWTHYVVAEQATENATGFSMRARFNSAVTGTAYFDDFTIEKMVDAPGNAIRPTGNKIVNVPDKYILLQNYPNPFNPETTIEYILPKQSKISLTIYDVLGHQVRKLAETVQESGYHAIIWDAKNDKGENVPTGMYLYVLTTSEQRVASKMVLMR
ncbi:MAG: FlgD immunoglobulin-like domain containing protein [Candidatus Marinimicrobia bacterium]|nr:FlgD immunoglobulin-like domain containing protein [Candidatus Neomarinimicrobiota bacterium]